MIFGDIATLRAAASDLNGQMRGKRFPASEADGIKHGSFRMPFSVLNVDVTGADIAGSPLVFESGDADGVLWPTERGVVPMPWLDNPSALVPVWMSHEDGTPYEGDPRHALHSVLERYAKRGWDVVASTEMEFHLVDDSGDQLAPPTNPQTGRPIRGAAILSLRQLDAFDAFFTDLFSACAAMDIPLTNSISEAGIGQYEVTLNHGDALRAADNAWLFKTMARGMARKHGLAATFMAKPFTKDTGNGMHVHFSVLDEDGVNIFDNGGAEGTDLLRQAVAGCLAAMPASTLIFAPHANSYERLVPGAHAPTGASWGYENRTAAIRIPGGSPKARRIEHRVAGGDVNPYLTLAAILGAAITGIEQGMAPPAPITGNAYELDVPQMAPDWESAIDRFETDPLVAQIFSEQLIENMVMTKRQELAELAGLSHDALWPIYLEAV